MRAIVEAPTPEEGRRKICDLPCDPARLMEPAKTDFELDFGRGRDLNPGPSRSRTVAC